MEEKEGVDDTLDKNNEVEVEATTTSECEVPANHYFVMNMQRLGEITSNMAVVTTSLIPLCLLGVVIFPVAMMINWFAAIMAVVFTVGLVLLRVSFAQMIIVKPETADMVLGFMFGLMNILSIATVVLSIVSIIALSMNKRNRSIGRIVGNVFMIVIACVCFVIKLLAI